MNTRGPFPRIGSESCPSRIFRGGHLLFGELLRAEALSNPLAGLLGGISMKPHPGFVVVNRGRAGKYGEAALFYFDKLNRVPGLQSKLFSNVKGKSNSAVEGNHR